MSADMAFDRPRTPKAVGEMRTVMMAGDWAMFCGMTVRARRECRTA
ncbi:hypothetical protein [Streptomyces phaeofaciens]